MKNRIIFCILSTVMLFLSINVSFGQKLARFHILSEPLNWTEKNTPNLAISVNGNKYLPQVGFYFNGAFQSLQTSNGTMSQEMLSSSFSGELRWFIFAKHPTKKRNYYQGRDRGGCVFSNFCYAEKKTPFVKKLAAGLYVAPGFRNTKTDFAVLLSDNTVGLEQFEAKIIEKAWTLYAGYQLRLACLTLDVGFGFGFGKPTVDDPHGLVDDSIYTATYPMKYRLSQGLRLAAGFNF